MPLKITIIDDHQAITDAFKNCLLVNDRFKNSYIQCFTTIESFYVDLSSPKLSDVVFLDLSMPSYSKENIEDGYHIAKILRKKFTSIKIIIMTMHSSPLYIYSVIQNIKPEAFLIKSDTGWDEINESLSEVVSGNVYYTSTAKNIIEDVEKYSFCNDEINRSILLLTSERYTNKEIAEKLLISISTVEKRKAMVKQILNIEGQNDKAMVHVLNNLRLI